MRVRIAQPVSVFVSDSTVLIRLRKEYPDLSPGILINTLPEKKASYHGKEVAVIPFFFRSRIHYVIKTELETSIGSLNSE